MNYETGVQLRKYLAHILEYITETLSYFHNEVLRDNQVIGELCENVCKIKDQFDVLNTKCPWVIQKTPVFALDFAETSLHNLSQIVKGMLAKELDSDAKLQPLRD